ncbi:MAG: TonB-dependent receptor [Bacteroidota bacterium]|nr:TonB-dependent receptor [Bacteroidota bacterium]
MKKHREWNSHIWLLKKLLRIMKLTSILILVFVISVSAAGYSQSTKLSINVKNGTFVDVLKQIENQSEFYFYYNNDEISKLKDVSISVSNKKIQDVLEELLSGTNLEYKIIDRYIALKKKEGASNDQEIQQQKSVSGKVTDSSDAGLPGVSVVVKGTTFGSITDTNGNYSISNLQENSSLQFSFIGMKTLTIVVGNNVTINVILEEETIGIDEVVAIGYGTVKKKDLTTAVSTVKMDDTEKKSMANLTQAIQGKVAGVSIIQASGKPNGNFSIQIRGATSISSSNNPLYVVDGMPTDDIQFINPSDIESMQILKDASSCAIYGARAANGVILISTKRGQVGKSVVTVKSTFGISNMTKQLGVLNTSQLVELINDERINAGLPLATNLGTLATDNNWQDIIFSTATSSDLQLSFSGGSEKTKFYFSVDRLKNDGIIKPSTYERYTLKLNLDHEMYKWLSFGSNISFSKSKSKDITDNATINEGGTVLGALNTPSFIEKYTEEGYFGYNPFNGQDNPLASMYGSNSASQSNNLLGNIYTKINLSPNLSFKTSAGVDGNFTNYDNFTYVEKSSYAVSTGGGAVANSGQGLTLLFENILDYSQTFGKHAISAIAGMTSQTFKGEDSWLSVKGFPNSSVQTLNAASTATGFGTNKYESSLLSYLSRVSYAYDDKYLFSANFRRDGSSKFGANNKYGNFPSFSAGWRISKEPFLSSVTAISDLKVRASYGYTGNQSGIDYYAHLSKVGLGALYPFSGNVVSGYYPSTIGNESLKWETTKQSDFGIDLSLLDSRIMIVMDVYSKNTSDALMEVNLPLSTGYSTGLQNFAKVQNKGLEFEVTTRNLTGNFKWTTDANFSINRNKIIRIAGGNSAIIYTGDIIRERGYVTTIREGHPMSEFYGFKVSGVNSETGDIDYIKKDGSLGSYLEMDADSDRTVIGNPNPKFAYGVTNSFSYKGFNLSILLQGVYGNKVFNSTRLELESMEGYKNASTAVLNRWKNPGDITDIPRAVFASSINSEVSDRFVENGSYLRVKNVTLSYDLKSNLLKRLQVSNLNVFITGQNLLTFTKYTGYDPEVSVSTNPTSLGVDTGTYPNVRAYTFGLNVTF